MRVETVPLAHEHLQLLLQGLLRLMEADHRIILLRIAPMGRNIPRATLVSIIQGITELVSRTIQRRQHHLLAHGSHLLHRVHRTSPG